MLTSPDVMGSHQAGAYTLCLSLRATSLKATGKSRRAALALDQTPLTSADTGPQPTADRLDHHSNLCKTSCMYWLLILALAAFCMSSPRFEYCDNTNAA